jgi:hypothetical protein
VAGFVYFIGPEDWRVGKVKIGRTISGPRGRLSALQTGSPLPLTVYAYVPGGAELEALLHETFHPLRQHGEWFNMDGKLLALVSCMYSYKLGQMFYTELEFRELASEVLCTDEPPHAVFCSTEQWIESADIGRISEWLHDLAWAEYQAQQANEAIQ